MLLKRLFIGLLILSALTAEGMAFFNSALVPLQNCMADLYGDDYEKAVISAGALGNDASFGSVKYGTNTIIPLGEILEARDNFNVSFCLPYSFTVTALKVSYGTVDIQTAGFKNIGIPLNGSDISPPSL